MPDVHEELLDPIVVVEARAALIQEFTWFVHETSSCKLALVRKSGLWPKPQESASDARDAVTIVQCRNILCLNPFNEKMEPWKVPKSSQSPPWIRFAVSGDDLPTRIGIDWSSEQCWSSARTYRRENAELPASKILVAVAKECASIACYDTVIPSKLHVRTEKTKNLGPSKWPLLSEVLDRDVYEERAIF
jgi:hypothetical protein